MIKKIFTDSFLYALGPQIPRLASILIFPLITKYLMPEDYAISGIATACLGGMTALRFLGLDTVMMNKFFINEENEEVWRGMWKQVFGFILKWGIIYVILLTLLLYFVLYDKTQEYTWKIILLLIIPSYLFDVITIYGSRYFINKRKPLPIAIISTLVGIVSVTVLFVSVVYFQKRYMAFFYSTFISSLISATCYFYLFFLRQQFYPDFSMQRQQLWTYLKSGLPVLPHNYSAYLLGSSDRLMLSFYKEPLEKIGTYNFGYSLANYFEAGVDAIGLATIPVISRLIRNKNEKSDKFARDLISFLQWVLLLIGVMISIWAREIFSFLSSNPTLEGAYPYAIIIIMAYVSRPLFWLVSVVFFIHDKNYNLWKTSFVGGLINVGLNLIFIPDYGVYACMFTTFAAFMYMTFSGFQILDFKRANKQKYHLGIWALIYLGATALVYLTKDYSVNFKIILTACCIALFYFIFLKYREILAEIKEI